MEHGHEEVVLELRNDLRGGDVNKDLGRDRCGRRHDLDEDRVLVDLEDLHDCRQTLAKRCGDEIGAVRLLFVL